MIDNNSKTFCKEIAVQDVNCLMLVTDNIEDS